MERLTIQVGTFDVNCTLLTDGANTWIVDPGQEGERIVSLIEKRNLLPCGILLTHAHFDHIGAINALQARWPDLPVYLHPDEVQVLTHPLNAYLPDYPPISRPTNILDARELPSPFAVIETPGHTPGGVCYSLPADNLLLSGDTLFAGSIGRTDLPGGDLATLQKSLARLATLPDGTYVIPGHGPHTTIGAEKTANPFLI
jgi:glyoxylase-like metal-dependent hydrolase (beta-lactamase superfamily II)